MNKYAFQGRVAFVTGASSGIGRATAELLGAGGACVALGYHRNATGAQEAVEHIRRAGGCAIAVPADFTRMDEVRAAVEQVQAQQGAIDILVNNAGSLVERLRTPELTEERWDEVFALNTKSAFFAAQAALPKMLEKKAGVIVNVASIAGRNGGALGSIHYSAAKGAVITLTKGLAKEFAPHGIRVNAVSPGVIDTPFHETFSTPEAMQNFAGMIPLGRVGTSAEVAQVIAFLASEAASYLCGETIEINGGMLML